MNIETAKEGAGSEASPRVRRRLAFYLGGLDPRGHKFLFATFREQFAKHIALNGFSGAASDVDPPPADKPWLKRWHAVIDDGSGPVETVVDFLEWQDLIPRRRDTSLLHRIRSGLTVGWHMYRKGVFRNSKRYGRGHYYLAMYPFALLVLNIVMMAGLPILGLAAGAGHGLVWALAGLVAGGALSFGWYRLTLALERKLFGWFLLDFWAYQEMQGRDEKPIIERFERFADHIHDEMADPAYDEVVIFALSTGGYVCINLIASVLARDPGLKQSGRHLPFVTFGVAPSIPGWFGPTERFLASLRIVLSSPTLTWVNYHVRKDPMSAKRYDPVRDFDLDTHGFREPMILYREIDIRDMLTPETLKKLRGNLFRKHLLYMMASETGEEHDFFALICSPRPVLAAADVAPPAP